MLNARGNILSALMFGPSGAQAHCGDPAVDAKVNEKVAQFCAASAKHPRKIHQVQHRT
jgi:hypothetical protein